MLIWILNIFDYTSTSILLQNGGQELNPLMNWMMELIGTEQAMLVTKIPFLGLLTYVTIRAYKKVLTKRETVALPCGYIIIISFYSYVMYNYNLQSLLI
jgi:hypothetical protein